MYACDNIHFKGYLESSAFGKYFFFPFPAPVYKRFDNNWILSLCEETLQKQSLTIKGMGELLDRKKLFQEICMRKN